MLLREYTSVRVGHISRDLLGKSENTIFYRYFAFHYSVYHPWTQMVNI